MPTLNPDLVPTINPGDLFNEFSSNDTLNIRWLTATDPAYYEVINRPMVDIALRQMIIARAMDSLETSLGFVAIFPFVVPPLISDGSTSTYVPIRVFWDMHVSVPVAWTKVRLARIDRLDGENGSGSYTGALRYIFSGQRYSGGSESPTETAMFYADYIIDSGLTYQMVRIVPAGVVDCPDFSDVVDAGEGITIDGEIIFRTLDAADIESAAFFDLLAPSASGPMEYEIVDSTGTATDPDFDASSISHGTGILTASAVNMITPVDADPLTWITAFNYPFALDAVLTSDDASSVAIPTALFTEFNIVAPAGDRPTGDVSGEYFPVWVNRIERSGISVVSLTFYFSTFGISPVSSSDTVEFASLTLTDTMTEGQIVGIEPTNPLFTAQTGADWNQEFGRGHVVLSSKWGITGGEVETFFNTFAALTDAITEVTFADSATRLSSWSISRVPKYSPTAGQAAALVGTSSERITTPAHPSAANKYVTALDEGRGDSVDLNAEMGSSHTAIDQYGYMATRAHKLIKLVVDPAKTTDSGTFYDDEILPRLTVLYGRAPIFGDIWYTGNRFLTFNGDAWID